MSINSALLAGVSGLVANSSALAAISDNIANVNTVAYKRNQVNFSNVVTTQSVSGRYSAGGVQGITRHYVSQQGLIQAANSSTDLAISGEGFFVVSDKALGLTDADERVFTRAGSFGVDASGYLVNDSGLFLQGWPLQSDGTYDVNPSDLSKLGPINVRTQGAAVTPTTLINLAANLDKGATAPVDVELKMIDATGGSHAVNLNLTRDVTPGNEGEWTAVLTMIPPGDITSGTPGQIATGTVTFNSDGTIDLANTDFGGTGTEITIDASGGTNPAWSAAQNLPAQTLTIDLSNLTQYAQATSIDTVSQNGAGAGSVVAVQVDENGIISAIYNNSQVRQVAKLALATFPNPDGLLGTSGNAYRGTIQSGQFVLKEPGNGSAGKIASSSLEASTVDLSAEFTGLITTQKAYSASSKIITTADQMLEELINIKR